MKKFTILFFLFYSILCFSQSNKQIIQSYLNKSTAKSGMSKSDIQDWDIESEGISVTTKIENCYVIQQYNGIPIFRGVSNFLIKEGQVIGNNGVFISKLSSKVNAVNPTLSAINALLKVYSSLGIIQIEPLRIIEKNSGTKFKITSGLNTKEPINANLVYHQASNGKLILAWDLTIETPIYDHIWSVRIDAQTGGLLDVI
jgi:hypothetical protein